MKNYYTVKIECDKEVKLIDIVNYVDNHFDYDRRLFEIFGLKPNNIKSKRINEMYERLGLEKYSYSYILPHLRNPDYPLFSRYPGSVWHSISNLDDNWKNGNPTCHESIDEDKFSEIIDLCQNMKGTHYTSFMVGMDEIKWEGSAVEKGTHGYEIAKTAYDIGEGYLSNSVIITKTPINKPNLIVYFSCESKYRELDCVKQLIAFLGKIKYEKEIFAPSDEKEREVWNKTREIVERRINKYKVLSLDLPQTVPNKLKKPSIEEALHPEGRINIKKLEKEMLCTDGWEQKSNDSHYKKAVTSKIIGGIEYKMCLDSLRGGHYIHIWFSCSSKYFEYHLYSGYSDSLIDEEQAVLFIKNADYLREKFLEIMTDK
ncbi:MAG: hypothetical protein IJS45_10820 [Clostridia bacterium]|nr:hypothetical protein [Clostridia bacterium]